MGRVSLAAIFLPPFEGLAASIDICRSFQHTVRGFERAGLEQLVNRLFVTRPFLPVAPVFFVPLPRSSLSFARLSQRRNCSSLEMWTQQLEPDRAKVNQLASNLIDLAVRAFPVTSEQKPLSARHPRRTQATVDRWHSACLGQAAPETPPVMVGLVFPCGAAMELYCVSAWLSFRSGVLLARLFGAVPPSTRPNRTCCTFT